MGYVRKFLKCQCSHCYSRRKEVVDEHLRRYKEIEPWNNVSYDNTPPEIRVRVLTDPFKMMADYLACDEAEELHREELKRIDNFNTNFRLLVGLHNDLLVAIPALMLILSISYYLCSFSGVCP